jgi:hypothetical protein
VIAENEGMPQSRSDERGGIDTPGAAFGGSSIPAGA